MAILTEPRRLIRSLKTLRLLYILTFICVFVFFYQVFVARKYFEVRTLLDGTKIQPPTVVIAFLVRNKAHMLPWFLGLIEKLDFPKNETSIWIRSDHNIDNSTAILEEWLTTVQYEYHSVDVGIDHTQIGYSDEKSSNDWSKQRFENVIKLRQQALEDARRKLADYIFMVDADVIIENNKTLQLLMDQNKIIVGPMFNASDTGYYSNFWEGINTEGYYVRTEEYLKIVDWEIRGCFNVPILHSALLIDLRRSITQHIAYTPPLPGYNGPYNDIIMFAHSVKAAEISMFILNIRYFGKVMVSLESQYSLREEIELFAYLRNERMMEGSPLYRSKHIYVPPIPQSKLGFDEIYMIHLLRRPGRKTLMTDILYDLGMDFTFFDAVDGKKLNDTYLDRVGIVMLPGYRDPNQGRPLTMGEIGCFLSHYTIWEQMVSKNYKRIIIFEDDVQFKSFFKRKLATLMKEVEELVPNWDLIYLGRLPLEPDSDVKVQGSSTLMWPDYSYGCYGYILSRKGADKLLSHKPLHRMMALDEYIPILFNKHPKEEWKMQFKPRNLVAVSADPLLLEQYSSDISDTEDAPLIETDDSYTDNEESY